MNIRGVVFEFIASRQTDRETDRQTDRRGGGLCFIICIDIIWPNNSYIPFTVILAGRQVDCYILITLLAEGFYEPPAPLK